MRSNPTVRTKRMKLTMFASNPDPNHQETGTEQLCQVLRASHTLVTYVEKNPRLCEFFYTPFRVGKTSAAFIAGGQFLQTLHDSVLPVALVTLDIPIQSIPGVHMLIHSVAKLEGAI